MTQSTQSQPEITITPEATVGSLVAAQPALARLFERLGIDYCCGGKQTLAAACTRLKLDIPTTVALLASAGTALGAGNQEVDASAMKLSQLADHIVATHHAWLKAELPRLVEMSHRVATKHAWRDARLPEVAAAVSDLASEMIVHMQKEELVLFPLVRRIEAGARGDITAPVAQMESEHESAGRLTARLRLLTDGFTPNAEACNTHRALLAGLADFEADLHQHVHKENNILFPRALALARAG
ncbi:MAG TPA: iron-sulfur cluster repair di-iron protein [Lacunisphaera sp.]|jgi:regulator of cell morphogenesis and NO signaling|nr:iron-sulfur cluster repair di-iron protein [Lacunisphaera sp.]